MDGAPVAALLALAPLTSRMRLASVLSCAQVEDASVYWWARSPIDQPGALPESSSRAEVTANLIAFVLPFARERTTK